MEQVEELYRMLKDNRYFPYFEVKAQYERRDMSKEERMAYFKSENQRLAPYMNKYENPFLNIMSFEERLISMFSAKDHIVVQEKIDGSNTHLEVTDKGFVCYGNRYVLNEYNHLQGYWYWCRDHYKQIPKQYYGLAVYGEWMTPHHCSYPADKYGEFYVFDVMEDGKYWTQDKVAELAQNCDFQYAPVLYDGEFISWEHLISLVGQTKMGAGKGEGVVVKDQTTLNSAQSAFYVKIVSEEFQETAKRKNVKTVNMDKVAKKERGLLLAESIVTVPRVRKIILKLVDAKELQPDWFILSEKEIMSAVKPYVYKDCVKEESETVNEIGNIFGKYCNDFTLKAVRTLKEEYSCD